ncbi:hypothetical protein KW798_03480 [Candidatus Parcubacteria bacterium]|nr:hypothetical protein [Candidatus Parcubacteria bacterium]
MDELEISGKRYISAKRAGRENKYHPDYIGQLIRANKVVGQKVGRSWYVDEQSLTKYFSGEAAVAPKVVAAQVAVVQAVPQLIEPERPTVQPNPVQEYIPASMRVQPVQVQPATPAPEVKHEVYLEENPVPVSIAPQSRRGGLTYMSDESPLYPQVSKQAERSVEVVVEEATPMREQYIPRDVMATPKQKIGKGSVVVLATLGVLTFAVIAGASYLLNYTYSVEGENTSAATSFKSLRQNR